MVFIRLITMIISLIIFCTVVSGIASMQDLKKVGRVGGKALIYSRLSRKTVPQNDWLKIYPLGLDANGVHSQN